jgi:hypothetical protein
LRAQTRCLVLRLGSFGGNDFTRSYLSAPLYLLVPKRGSFPRIGRMMLCHMQIELSREPGDVLHGIRDARLLLRHLLSAH